MKVDNRREELRKVYQRQETASDVVFIPAKDKIDIFSENQLIRVCAYCRVSTDSDEQLSSFELQKQHYEQLASKHLNWELLHIYADEGISGTSTKGRQEFLQMLEDCRKGMYDMIVTKSVSRFARNITDCINIIRELKNQAPPVGVFFETDNFFTLNEESELHISILATFAQEESVKKSESMNWSLKERFKSQKLLTPDPYGYRRQVDAVGNYVKYAPLIVVEEEARIIRFIFDAYLAGFRISTIAELLSGLDIPTKTGSPKWSEGSINYILRNERYCGNVLTWKTFTADIFKHTHRKNRQDRDQYLYKNVHDAIISLEQFEAVQVLMEQRKHGYRGGYPVMHVIDVGIFSGFVPINHRWSGDDANDYYNASNSVIAPAKTKKYDKRLLSAFDLSGYQVVRAHFLTTRNELPCLSITEKKISFNSNCTRQFDQARFVQLLLHPVERKLALRPCESEDVFSILWKTDPEMVLSGKTISCHGFLKVLFDIMDWNPDYNYKVFGTVIQKDEHQIVIFNLQTAIPILSREEVNEGNILKKVRYKVLPENWEDTFGDDFYDYVLENSLYYLPTGSNSNVMQPSRAVNDSTRFEAKPSWEVNDIYQSIHAEVKSNDQ